MRPFSVSQAAGLKGEVRLPGDKSIAHRCIIAASLCRGRVAIKNFPANQDCLFTLSAFRNLGIKIKRKNSQVWISGSGLKGLKKPHLALFVGDSGTTLRLLLGVLAGQNFVTKLTAGKSLSQRPMRRVTEPLRMMGADIKSKIKNQKATLKEYPPITIRGGKLKPITYRMPVASAQVKSAILLAGLYSKGITRVIEPIKTRDHTERILKLFGAGLKVKQNTILIKGGRKLVSPGKIYIPADISSASFFIAAALLCPNSKIKIRKVSLNPTRTGCLRVLKRMGADIQITNYQLPITNYEPMGDMLVKSSRLKGVIVKNKEIPSLIDELPILMVAACFARGRTVLGGIGELRVKETDRIRSMSQNLRKMGADIKVVKKGREESIIIAGVKALKQARVRSFADHRTAMSMVVAGLKAKGTTTVDDITCINKSFPGFTRHLKRLLN